VVACVAVADDVGTALDAIVAVASGVALGASAVAAAHPATKIERIAAAMIRMRDIIALFERVRGKTSLKT
jgi:hypothetical protein